MRNTGILYRKQDQALKKIVKPFFDGKMDYSDIEKPIYFGAAPLFFVYASWESCRFYFDIGGDGTKYLPIGNFTKEFGGNSSFIENGSVIWFLLQDTLITARKEYYEYQIAQELGLPIPKGKILAKFAIATLLSAAAGAVIALIAGSKYGLWNQVETGVVNGVLNFIGAMQLQTFIVLTVLKTKDLLYHYICKQTGLEDDIESMPSTEWISEQLSERTKKIKDIPNDDPRLLSLKTIDGYLKCMLTADESHNNIIKQPKTPCNTALSRMYWILKGLLYAFMQVCDKVSIYGFWQDTIHNLKEPPFNCSKAAATFLGSTLLISFAALTSFVTHITTRDGIIGLSETAWQKTKDFFKEPKYTSTTAFTLIALTIAGSLALTNYFPAYISSDTSLELNAEYGLDQLWSVALTTIGTTVFNGFGFLSIIMEAYKIVMSFLLYSTDKRHALDRHAQITSFFNNYPTAVDDLANKEQRVRPSPGCC